ncbi:hypothetical protein C8Q77DRAFT_1141988 [Trametes polyzona]|nr:hypothetical protein C8Q77DRAFT_1141988 [Trametes polyzona]
MYAGDGSWRGTSHQTDSDYQSIESSEARGSHGTAGGNVRDRREYQYSPEGSLRLVSPRQTCVVPAQWTPKARRIGVGSPKDRSVERIYSRWGRDVVCQRRLLGERGLWRGDGVHICGT